MTRHRLFPRLALATLLLGLAQFAAPTAAHAAPPTHITSPRRAISPSALW
jgi:hypothetical protein